MKSKYFRYIITIFFLGFISGSVIAQDLEKGKLKELVQNKNFVFKAQTASPMSGTIRQLTGEYDVRVIGDSIVSFLPYFGRAYTAPMPGQSGGIQFTSTGFAYKTKERKKGGWEITILPKNAGDVRQMFLTVSEKGYATLQVTTNNRQPISFSGYIVERK